MMTKQDYKKLAEVLSEAVDNNYSIERTINEICAMLRADNPKFDKTKFIEAIFKNK